MSASARSMRVSPAVRGTSSRSNRAMPFRRMPVCVKAQECEGATQVFSPASQHVKDLPSLGFLKRWYACIDFYIALLNLSFLIDTGGVKCVSVETFGATRVSCSSCCLYVSNKGLHMRRTAIPVPCQVPDNGYIHHFFGVFL